MAGNLERVVCSRERVALPVQSDTLWCSRCRERYRGRKAEAAKQTVAKHVSGEGEIPSTVLAGKP